jgi:hypothetical protein
LLIDIDKQLREDSQDTEALGGLHSAARRVVDRQIAMLDAASTQSTGTFWQRIFATPLAGAGRSDLYFEYAPTHTAQPRVLLADHPEHEAESEEQVNTIKDPAYFNGITGDEVCSTAPSGKYAVKVNVAAFDTIKRSAEVTMWASTDGDACIREASGNPGNPGDQAQVNWQPLGRDFSISPYDFPLTDNTQIDPAQRVALNLYYYEIGPGSPEEEPSSAGEGEGEAATGGAVGEVDADASVADPNDSGGTIDEYAFLQVRLVWFPEGYITERERPVNYYEVNKVLDRF